ETPIFQKRQLLYNLSDARKVIRKQDEVILMEGHLDVVKVKMTNVQNIVGLMGTALSEENIRTLNRLASNITFMFDVDEPCQNAQMSLGEQLLNSGANVYVIPIPKGTDPDEFIESRVTALFESLVKNERKHYIHFKADQLLKESLNNDMIFSTNLITLA